MKYNEDLEKSGKSILICPGKTWVHIETDMCKQYKTFITPLILVDIDLHDKAD